MKRPALKMPKVSFERMLPILSGGLIAGLFVIAGLILLSPNIEPETPPKGVVTSVAINGFQGLRKALEAEGYRTRLNRQEAGRRVKTDDLMIVTLDGDAVLYEQVVEGVTVSPLSVREEAQAPASGQKDVTRGRDFWAKVLDDEHYVSIPNHVKSHQILYEPLGRAVLVVAPKWTVSAPDPRKPRWAGQAAIIAGDGVQFQLGLLSPQHVTEGKNGAVTYSFNPHDWLLVRADHERGQSYAIKPAVGQDIVSTGFTSGKITGLQSISGSNLTPLLVGPNGEVLLSKVNPLADEEPFAAPVYLLSDPDLLNNSMFAHPERMAGMLKVIDQLTGAEPAKAKVVFDITFNDLAQDSDLMHHISRPPFVGVPLALMVLALGLVWVAAARFGPAHNPYSETPHGRGVRTLADNAARLVAKAGRETKLMPAYAQLVRDQVLKQAGFVPNALMTADEMADRLSERHGTDEFYGNLFAETDTVKGIGNMLVLAKKLRHWKSQITKTEA
ncbi:hypothetical protein [Asticcacaulis tiandongensis]|uniref:hypothetical protein n=1 Tax=Asticcacaulis tiandongensis TaxID=2565365 RepID=UPI00112DDDBE|nr:hypothetical protein [Asticcacaulis tiandongensis]